MCEQRRTENGAWALQWQLERTSPEQTTPKTISPKDVDIVCRESEEDTNTPLFPPQQQSLCHQHQRQSTLSPKPPKSNENASERSHSSVATAEQGSSSAYSTSPQAAQQQGRQMPQQYPFIPRSRKQPSSLPSVTNDFPTTLASMESSSSEYAPEILEGKKPLEASADTRTYTCTYHGCALRFDTLAKLQRHKREGHRNSASVINGGDGRGMTSAGQRNSQAGPHKCERINPSTGKPCNTIFSRPYDLTRHEDTIHNAKKQKVHCPLCAEEKTFSRNDALTRHLRVVHPDHVNLSKSRG